MQKHISVKGDRSGHPDIYYRKYVEYSACNISGKPYRLVYFCMLICVSVRISVFGQKQNPVRCILCYLCIKFELYSFFRS